MPESFFPLTENLSEKQWLAVLQNRLDAEHPSDLLVYLSGDMALADPVLTLELAKLLLEYRGDYGYAEGYPDGLVPEIIRLDALPQLAELATEQPFGGTRRILERDLNRLAVETLVADSSLQFLRVDLRCNNPINTDLVNTIIAWQTRSGQSALSYLQQFPHRIRTLPASLQLLLCRPPVPVNSYSPQLPAQGSDFMAAELWQKAIEQLQQLNPQAVLVLPEIGAAAQHPEIAAFLRWFLDHSHLQLVIETAAHHWDFQQLAAILERGKERIRWIVCLDTLETGTYQELRGGELEAALQLIAFIQRWSPEQLYIQAVRLDRNHSQLKDFYQHWQQQGLRPIIQKYNSFAGLLPERQPVKIAPLQRIPCQRLRREMAINHGGQVYLCLIDLVWQQQRLGELNSQDLGALWAAGAPHYQRHFTPCLPDLCQHCDEYYVWNF